MIRLLSLPFAVIGISGTAFAADLPPRAAPPPRAPAYVPAPPVYNWTGFYIGGNAGAAWTQGNVSDSFGFGSWSNSQQAVFTGGGQVGANYQFNWAVVGIEGDFDWLANNSNSSNAVFAAPVGALQFSANNRWMTTLAARFGVAADNWLFYAKGGGGWVGVNNPTVTNLTTGGSISFSNSNSNSGWLAGGGVEWGFAPNWTARLEYDFLGLSSQSYTVTSSGVLTPINGDVFTVSNRDVQTLTLGVNFLFH